MKTKFIVLTALLFIIFLVPLAEAKNIIKIGGDVTVETGQQVDSVIVVGAQVTVNGLVEKTIVAIGGSVILTSNAVVRGNVIVVGGIVAQGNGSQVFGDITEINSSNLANAIASVFRGEMEGWSLFLNIISLCFFAIILTMALLITFLLPRPLVAVTGTIQANKAKSFFWGVLATLMIVPFFMLLAISIIGITLIPLAFTMILLAFILGYIAAGMLAGNFILEKIFHTRKKSLVGATLLGLILLWLIGWIPYVGWIIKAVVLTFGLGGVLLALFHQKPRQATPSSESTTTSEIPTNPPGV
jgi:hypothetical protein